MIVKQIPTSIPNWYTAQYLERTNTIPEAGAHIRAKVPVTTKKITEQLQKEEQRLRKKFAGVANLQIHAVPDLQKEEGVAFVEGDSDREKVESYVRATWPEAARGVPAQAVSYLLGKLVSVSPRSSIHQLRFISLRATNALCFKELYVRYAKRGLVLLRGVNKDWPKQSNGAGKSSFLGLLYTALTGETPTKEQKHDAWAYERNKELAMLELKLRDDRKREIIVQRARRPHSLLLRVDGKDESTGIRGTGKNETQGVIERLTGYDKQLLLNAVYIDQTIANGFVFGGRQSRLELLNKLQNLERFDKALKLVKRDITATVKAREEFVIVRAYYEAEIGHLKSELGELQDQVKTDWEDKRVVAQKEIARLTLERGTIAELTTTYAAKQRELDEVESDAVHVKEKLDDARVLESSLIHRAQKALQMVKLGKCPQCEQLTADAWKGQGESASKAAATAAGEVQRWKKQATKLLEKAEHLTNEIQAWNWRREKLDMEFEAQSDILRTLEFVAKQERKRNEKLERRRARLQKELRRAGRVLVAVKGALKQAELHRELLEYALKAFQRTGMPMHLSAALCPALNRAADEYSELFCGSRIQLRFSVAESDFRVDVVNPAGSSKVGGQSTGESAVAGLIAAFALRDMAPKTNLLILDEPGAGLDEQGARQFAQGLLQLKDRYETILVTTHHPAIMASLSGETTWTVTKEKGVSTLSL